MLVLALLLLPLLLLSVHLFSQDADEIFLFTDVDVQYFQPATDLEH